MYEELLDKLTAQNKKLKSWIKHRKRKDDKMLRSLGQAAIGSRGFSHPSLQENLPSAGLASYSNL
jgi:hypothetical protein